MRSRSLIPKGYSLTIRRCKPQSFVVALALWVFASSALGEESDLAYGWQNFERAVREERIPLAEALRRIEEFRRILPAVYPAEDSGSELFFPLKGYGLRHVGGKLGEGYRPSRYEFAGPRRRIGHPAQDIFVFDGNQDGLDDRFGKPIEVLAFAAGIVVSAFADWIPGFSVNGNGLRGGNYLWIYHPALGLFSYSAHLERLLVATGERVAGGAPIATLGRSGTNAYAERSPTHLHFMLLRLEDMKPVNPYPLLQSARETR